MDKNVRQKVEDYAKKLKSNDPRFNRISQIILENGSVFFFKNAFIMTLDLIRTTIPAGWSGWIIVFSNNQDNQIFEAEIVTDWKEYDIRKKGCEELK